MGGASIKVGRRSVAVSNPDKVLFPDDGITKRRLIDHYLAVARRMLPEVADRMITMERFPDGIDGQRFFQKSISDFFPDWIERKTVPKKGGTVTHVVITEKATLAYLANLATITMHMSLSKRDRPEYPDQLIFDLDPSVEDFSLVRRTALELRSLLDELGLFSVVKTSGSRGLHVTVPLDGRSPFEEVRRFARDVAAYMVSQDAGALTIEGRKEDRGDRLYLDWMRNSTSATVVAPYSVRALPGAPVAMPLAWEEVEDRRLTPRRYTLKRASKAIEEPNPWQGWRRRARSLKGPARRLSRLSG